MLAETWLKIIRKFAVFWSLILWPLSSPDNNTLDYALSGVFDSKVKATWYENNDHQKLKITWEWPQLPTAFISKINKTLRGCLEGLIEAEGWHLEKY